MSSHQNLSGVALAKVLGPTEDAEPSTESYPMHQLGSVITLGGPEQAWMGGMRSACPVGCTWCGHATGDDLLPWCIQAFSMHGPDPPIFVFSAHPDEQYKILRQGKSLGEIKDRGTELTETQGTQLKFMVETGDDQWYMVDGCIGGTMDPDTLTTTVQIPEMEGHMQGPYQVLEVEGRVRRYDRGVISIPKRVLVAVPTIGYAAGRIGRTWKYLRQQLCSKMSGRTGQGEHQEEEEGRVCSWLC